jgi:membrane protease YdiL (CAAX protease family)
LALVVRGRLRPPPAADRLGAIGRRADACDTLYDMRGPSSSTSDAKAADCRRPLTVWHALGGYVAAVLVASVTGGIAAALSADDDGVAVLLAGQVGFWGVLVAVVALSRFRSGADVWPLGAQVRWIDLAGVAVGVFTQVALLPLLYLPFRPLFDEEDLSAPAEELLAGIDGAGLAAIGVGVVLVAPVVEELFFRGLLLGTMRSRWGTGTAAVVSSLFFAATHFQPLQFAGLTLAGLVFAAAVVRTGRLGSAIAVHIGFNATTFVALALL